ncbi:MAG TPA: Hsp20/alpha crystallin family protein [Kiloniellales bacterium]|nr:Hsp20/alpha crystallin family protein [Kiloniellales bacterium]
MFRELVPTSWTRPLSKGRSETSDPIALMRQEMNRLFDDFWHDFGLTPNGNGWSRGGLAPRVDVSEDDKEIQVVAELPGLEEKDVEVTFADGLLTIRGEREQSSEKDDKRFYLKERSYGAFQRVIPLVAEIDEDKVKATFDKGVLTVVLPKTESAKSKVKRIPLTH